MSGLCKLIANVSKEGGEKKTPWQPESRGPTLQPSEETGVHLTRRIRRKPEEKAGRGVGGGKRQARAGPAPSIISQFTVQDTVSAIWEGGGFRQESSFSISPLLPSSTSPLLGRLFF